MMDWTDRHCRVFHRMMSRESLLYTEMVNARAILHGDRGRHLDYDAAEHPLALQLGGSEPDVLAEAGRIAADWGYDEINLNCGCPSDRVQSGCFGAVLMRDPQRVADCVAALIAAQPASQPAEVTVKCRIGVDDQPPEDILPQFLETVAAAGVSRFTIHARKAWLQGLSPAENRTVPPLDYPLVYEMKRAFPHLHLSINGGVSDLGAAEALLAPRDGIALDGVMIGRAAYHDPLSVFAGADQRIFGRQSDAAEDPHAVVAAMKPYIARHLEKGGRLHQITRHMLGLFHCRPGARHWRRVLSEGANRDGAGLELLDKALPPQAQAA